MDSTIQKHTEEFFSGFERKLFRKGDIIIRPEETSQKAYYLRSGYVRTYCLSPEGIELTLHIFTPHAYFPMLSVISDVQNRHFYEAFVDTEVYIAPKAAVVEYLQTHSDALYDLTSRLLRGIDKLTMRIEHLAMETANKRIVSSLLFLARHFGEQDGNKVRLKYTFTHKDLASFAGMSRETASREWEKLSKSGLVTIEKQHITILDKKTLSELGSA